MGLWFENKKLRDSNIIRYNEQGLDISNNRYKLQYATLYKSRLCPGKVYLGYKTIEKYGRDNTNILSIDNDHVGKDEYLKKFCDVCGYVLYDSGTNAPEFHMIGKGGFFWINDLCRKRIVMNWNGKDISPKLCFSSSTGEMELDYLDTILENQVTYFYSDMNSMIRVISGKLENRLNRYSKVRKR